MKANKFTKETIGQFGIADRKFPDFKPGDTIAVSQRVKEGNKERIQVFQGDVIASKNGNGVSNTFTVRKIGANSVAVERIYPYQSPLIEEIKVVKRGKVRRAKLFYIREKIGKASRLKEKILTHEQKEQKALARKNEALESQAKAVEAKPVEAAEPKQEASE